MIIACPACGTRYLVPANAIGMSGRRVRCASCRHSWFEEGAGTPPPDVPPLPPAPPRGVAEPESSASATDSEVGGYDAFAPAPPFRPRRNPARLWTSVAVAVAVVASAAIAALIAFGPLGGMLGGSGTSPLAVTSDPQVRKQLMPDGSELLAYSGRIRNPTGSNQQVPPIRAELRDADGRVLYGWTIAAPVSTLAAGASAPFNGSELNVPKGAVSIRFAPANRADARR